MATRRPFQVFDTTLRDGAQREGITLLGGRQARGGAAARRARRRLHRGRLARRDAQGHRVLRPRAAPSWSCEHALLVAFGATRKAGVAVDDDPQVRALLDAETPVVCLVAKSDVRHVERALRTTLEENLAMVARHRRVLRRRRAGGSSSTASTSSTASRTTRDYGVARAATALEAGAEVGVMCDTNGGMLPMRRRPRSSTDVRGAVRRPAGHPLPERHRLRGRQHGGRGRGGRDARPVHRQRLRRARRQRRPVRRGRQPSLKLGLPVLPEGACAEMVRVSHAIAEIANLAPDTHQAYVGASAFAHKAGLHASAIKVNPVLYNHIDPAIVGNDMRILVTEMAGRASIELKGRELGVDLAGQAGRARPGRRPGQGAGGRRLVVRGRRRVVRAAGARRAGRAPCAAVRAGVLPDHRRAPRGRRGGQRGDGEGARATGERVIATGRGQRPGQRARQGAARWRWSADFPELAQVSSWPTTRCASSAGGSGTERGHPGAGRARPTAWRDWTTVGVHENIVEACWHALVDALTYAVVRRPNVSD